MVEPAVQTIPIALHQHGERLTVALLSAVDQHVLLVKEGTKIFKRSQAAPPDLVHQSGALRSALADSNGFLRGPPEDSTPHSSPPFSRGLCQCRLRHGGAYN